MPDKEKVIKGVHDARRYLEDREWFDKRVGVHIDALNDALALLKEQEERRGNYIPCKVKTPTGEWNGEKCSVCGTEYIGSAPLQWKFCPDCGAKMKGR